MKLKRSDLAIINRSFWPVSPVIGEALMRFAEKQSLNMDVCVILQDHSGIDAHLKKQGRGKKVKFYPCKAWSVSSSGIICRIIDSVFFMFWVLAILAFKRPTKVYVSTDPPILVPFIVMLYTKFFDAKYIYHLQDIHPEATSVVIPLNKTVYRVLRWLDAIVMRQASLLLTPTNEMAKEILKRSATDSKIYVVSNPAVSFENINIPVKKKTGFSFCGNAGRLQRIPLLIEAIEVYCDEGGKLPFVFAGGGVFSEDLRKLSNKFANVTYFGNISADEAAQLSAEYEWALLPIEDEVTRYAFPSKSSSYVFSGAYVAAICGGHTSVAKWVKNNSLGMIISAEVDSLLLFFRQVERHQVDCNVFDKKRSLLKKRLDINFFVAQLEKVVTSKVGGG